MAFNYSGAALPVYAAKDAAITQRPTSTALLAIDSEDRYKTYPDQRAFSDFGGVNRSPYNFTINKTESIMNGFFTRVALTEVCFPWVVPNINQKTNKITVTYTAGGPIAIYQLTLPIGFYTPAALAAAIQTAVRAITPGLNLFTMTYGTNNLPVFTYATNNASTIAFAPLDPYVQPLVPAPPGASPYYVISKTTKQLFDILGFSASNTFPITGPITGGLTFAQATRYIDIVCTQLTNNQPLKDTMSQEIVRTALCRLYLGDGNLPANVAVSSSTFCPPGCAPFTIYRDYTSPKQIAWKPDQPVGGFLQFQVYDDNGDLLEEADTFSTDGFNHCDWSITLLVSEN